MIFLINLPVKVIRLLESNISPSEIAAGVCLGMFLGFTPLNGPMAILLLVFFLLIKLNRLSTLITLPLFKLFYILGMSGVADKVGGYLLIDAEYLTRFWNWFTGLPVIAYLDFNNTLVTGGIAVSLVLTPPVFWVSKVFIAKMKGRFSEKIRNNKFVKWFKKIPIIHKLTRTMARLRGES